MDERFYLSMLKNQPDVLTVPEAARILRIDKNKVYALVRDKTLNSIRLGRKNIIDSFPFRRP